MAFERHLHHSQRLFMPLYVGVAEGLAFAVAGAGAMSGIDVTPSLARGPWLCKTVQTKASGRFLFSAQIAVLPIICIISFVFSSAISLFQKNAAGNQTPPNPLGAMHRPSQDAAVAKMLIPALPSGQERYLKISNAQTRILRFLAEALKSTGLGPAIVNVRLQDLCF
ncbi:uncharacterized protein BBA_03989 [Beauveria bassiana ARSEF 2860]|uniref:Uncharacterized protein n=1 Tax=Beauveria bassiana (strain ARSEF 2860) TaxID=655819 RepID=J4WBC2_BEAB2|nr:uncharacterized protein BBA_03989 [Beauveria bassiana ARSEF 2860]EJP67415.1 hypothetical protein BBA_03989 [Beauveria bassiana ARSEF 2860]